MQHRTQSLKAGIGTQCLLFQCGTNETWTWDSTLRHLLWAWFANPGYVLQAHLQVCFKYAPFSSDELSMCVITYRERNRCWSLLRTLLYPVIVILDLDLLVGWAQAQQVKNEYILERLRSTCENNLAAAWVCGLVWQLHPFEITGNALSFFLLPEGWWRAWIKDS